MILSIIIPTYNRHEHVKSRVLELLPQLIDNVELIIVDNCSFNSVEDIINKDIPESVGRLKHIRNAANIGSCGNVCRCFEAGNGEWTWILGDDDQVEINSVSIILRMIESKDITEATSGIYFSTSVHSYDLQRKFTNLHDFSAYNFQTNPFRNALFMSSNVFRTQHARNNLRHAYHYSTTFIPHVVLALACVASGGEWVVSDQYTNFRGVPDEANQWSYYTLSVGITLLLELPFCSNELIKNIHHPVERYLWVPLVKGGLKMIVFNDNFSSLYWTYSLRRFIFLTKGIKKLKIIFLFLFALGCDKVMGFKSFFRFIFTSVIPINAKDHANSGQSRN
jgi:glycosyltransferase involved in cell wall biosynthesis